MHQSMKTLALVLALSPLSAFAGTPIDVKISGMTCGSCAAKVKEKLEALKGIDQKSLKVDFAGNHATMTIAQNDAKMMATIKKAVENAGFTVDKIDVVATATETKTAPKAN